MYSDEGRSRMVQYCALRRHRAEKIKPDAIVDFEAMGTGPKMKHAVSDGGSGTLSQRYGDKYVLRTIRDHILTYSVERLIGGKATRPPKGPCAVRMTLVCPKYSSTITPCFSPPILSLSSIPYSPAIALVNSCLRSFIFPHINAL